MSGPLEINLCQKMIFFLCFLDTQPAHPICTKNPNNNKKNPKTKPNKKSSNCFTPLLRGTSLFLTARFPCGTAPLVGPLPAYEGRRDGGPGGPGPELPRPYLKSRVRPA